MAFAKKVSDKQESRLSFAFDDRTPILRAPPPTVKYARDFYVFK